MEYGYYIEGSANGVRVQHTLEGYKSRRSVEMAARRYKERFKVAETGRVVFTFSGNRDRKYLPGEYSVLDRFNAKAFFEFWA